MFYNDLLDYGVTRYIADNGEETGFKLSQNYRMDQVQLKCHKVIEVEQDGRFIPVGDDVLKTKSSFHTLPLIPVVEQLLLAEKEKQETYRRLFKKSYCGDYLAYICVDQMGKLLRPNYVTEHFTWIVGKYCIKRIRFHDLRHTCASLLLANGVPMKQIQIWLGHSTFSTTADIYAHLDVSAQVETGDVAGGFFIKSSPAEPLALSENAEISTQQAEDAPQTLMTPTFAG